MDIFSNTITIQYNQSIFLANTIPIQFQQFKSYFNTIHNTIHAQFQIPSEYQEYHQIGMKYLSYITIVSCTNITNGVMRQYKFSEWVLYSLTPKRWLTWIWSNWRRSPCIKLRLEMLPIYIYFFFNSLNFY